MTKIVVVSQLAQGYPQTISFNTPKVGKSSWSDESEYCVHVGAVGGTPTTALLTAKFQVWVPNTTHLQEEEITGAWFDVNPTTDPGMFPDSDWPTKLADETTATAVVWTRRIRTAMAHRVAFTISFTGGTSPNFPLSIRHFQRG